MKYHFRFTHLIAALFVISFFLPSYGDAPGYSCAYLCLTITVNPESLMNEPWLWAYYTGFNVVNVAFIWIGLLLINERPVARWARIIIVLAALQVISWPAFNLESLELIGIGYYLWASAFMLLAIASNMKSIPKNPPEIVGRAKGVRPSIVIFWGGVERETGKEPYGIATEQQATTHLSCSDRLTPTYPIHHPMFT